MNLSSEKDIQELHKLIKEKGQYPLKQNKKQFSMQSLKQIKAIKIKD